MSGPLRASRQLAVGWLSRLGYFLPPLMSPDYGPELERTIRQVRKHTMTSPRRLAALCDSVAHVVRAEVPGAIVECGVWKGGSMMAAALTLIRLGATDRDLYLFDTFAGMPPPTAEDVFSAYDGYNPVRHWRRRQKDSGLNTWHYVPVDEVRAAVLSTGYPAERVHMVEGRVEDTLPAAAPDQIARAAARHRLVRVDQARDGAALPAAVARRRPDPRRLRALRGRPAGGGRVLRRGGRPTAVEPRRLHGKGRRQARGLTA